MNTPMVSVVMSVFNGERFLREAVESILEQSFKELEFIIIEDGSTDGTASILDSYRRRDPRVHVYSQANKGLIYSLNRGCGLARGKYIARMDADDIAMPDRLKCQFEVMEAHPEIGLLGGAVKFIDASGRSLRVSRCPLTNSELQPALLKSNVFWHPTVFVKKDLCVSLGYRAVVDAEDYDLWLRISERCHVANLDAVLLKYRIHPGQVSVNKCRQQALGAAAARIGACSRRNGKPDPLDGIGEITPAVLARLGASEAIQQTSLASGYLSCIRNMCQAGEHALAMNFLQVFRSADLAQAENWVIADFHLWTARLYWYQRQYAKSILNIAHALTTRPAVLGRPIKPLLRWMTKIVQTDGRESKRTLSPAGGVDSTTAPLRPPR